MTSSAGAMFVVECDGASSGNPGPAGIGVSLRDEAGVEIDGVSEAIGPATNNVAEYAALLRALEVAKAHGVRRLAIRMDSELVVKQVRGEYKVRQPHLTGFCEEARLRLSKFDEWSLTAVRRGMNARADALAKAGAQARSEGERGAKRK
ncbi:MAG: ribonuclease HI family protein [bacterium]